MQATRFTAPDRYMKSDSVVEKAAYWFIRSKDGILSSRQTAAYRAWLRKSPEHVAETVRVAMVYAWVRAAIPREVMHDTWEVLDKIRHDSVVRPLERTPNGVRIEAVPAHWLDLVQLLEKDPRLLNDLHWRVLEEVVAAAYEREGYEVELTPRSGDRGRDVIAVRRDFGTIRIFDQVKAYSPDRLVPANDVLAMVGVLSVQSNVSKGLITTTSGFAPGVYKDPDITRLMPYRLELRPRDRLLTWLSKVASDQ